MRLWLAIVCLFAVAATSHPAAAGPARIAVVAIDITGDAAPELREQVHAALQKGIQTAGGEPVSFDMVRTATEFRPELIGCTSITCLEALTELVNVERFVRAQIEADGATYSIQVQLLEASANGGVRRGSKDTCAVCTVTDLAEHIVEQTIAVLDDSQAATATVRISTDPAGATLREGDAVLGVSPLVSELPSGEHTIIAELPGYLPAEQRITVTASGDTVQDFQIIFTSLPPIDPEKGNKGSALKWVALGAGGLLFITGAVLIAIDGNQSCGDSAAACPEVYNTLLPGLLSIGAGVGLGGAGGWLWYQESKDKKAVSAGVAPTRGGMTARLAVTF